MKIKIQARLRQDIYKGWFLAGSIALVLIVEYVVAEAITASAWTNPVYSYAANYISDLGVSGRVLTDQHTVLNSPFYWLMNAGFMLEGLLTVVAAFLLRPLFVSGKWRAIVPALAIIHCVGMFMVAIVHGSPETMHARIGILHVIGAALAIICGNIQCICSGVAAGQSGAPLWYKAYSTFLGLLGIAGLIFLLGVRSVPPGIPERVSVYTIILWDITTGIFLLIGIRNSNKH